jgi:hypothetical protein
MNKIIQLFFYLPLLGFIFILTACDWFTWNTIDISGTVSITRNGETWYPDSVLMASRTESTARSLPPVPIDGRPRINAFTSPGGRNIGNNYNDSQPISEDDYARGLYHWTVQLRNVSSVPDIIYFEVAIPMSGLYPHKMTDGMPVGQNNSAIDLGLINFDVVRLYGNLPVTLDGEPLSSSPFMDIRREDGSYFVRTIYIYDGNWVQDVYAQDAEVPVTFNLTARESRATFETVLNPNQIITVHNTDKEIFFEYPSIDFQSWALSGTIEILVPHATRYWISIHFYDDDYTKGDIGSALTGTPHNLNEEGLVAWEALVPAFSFPKTLLFRVNMHDYQKDSQITITEDTDLKNINLGTFRD